MYFMVKIDSIEQRAHIHVAFTLLLFLYSQYVQVQVWNEKENDVVRLVYSIEDDKIVKRLSR